MKTNKQIMCKLDSYIRDKLKFIPLEYFWFGNRCVRIKVRKASTLRRIETLINNAVSKNKTIQGHLFFPTSAIDTTRHSFLDICSIDRAIFITYHT